MGNFPEITPILKGNWVKIHKLYHPHTTFLKIGQYYKISDIEVTKTGSCWLLFEGAVQTQTLFPDNHRHNYVELISEPSIIDTYPEIDSLLIGCKIEIIDNYGENSFVVGNVYTVKCTRKNEIYIKEKKKWWRVLDNKRNKQFKVVEYANIIGDIFCKLEKLEQEHE